jgi:hypothetical protein
MADVQHVYEDGFGEIVDRPALELVELRWYDTTATMSDDQFQDWLTTFAGHVERLRRPRVLVDGTRFMMDPSNLNDEWRDANIIPRYNAAGVRRFAFLFPDGMPAIGAPPVAEGPATFPTGYFARRPDALEWLGADRA